MAKNFLVPIDLNKQELRNAVLQNAATASAPASPVDGQMYFDTDLNKPRIYDADATSWRNMVTLDEDIQDVAAGLITGATHTNITATYNDAGGTLALAVSGLASSNISDFNEAAQDAASSMITGATHTNITATYNDVGNTLALAVSGLASSNISDFTEAAQDAAASMITAATHSKISVTYNDAGNTLAFSVTGLAAADISDFDTQVRTSRLDQMAAPTASVSLNSQKITNLATPTADSDAATKGYVDGVSQGLDVKKSVRLVAASAVTSPLSGTTYTIDGVAVVAGDRVLLTAQATVSENGIWIVNAGAWTRPTDFDVDAEVTEGAFTFVEEGTSYEASGWVISELAGSLGSHTTHTWTRFSGAGQISAGDGLTMTGNTLAVGAGTGITVNADDVQVTRTNANGRVPLLYAVDVGDGAATSITVTHNLNTLDCVVQIYRKSDGVEVECDVTRATVNTVTLGFGSAPTAAQYRAVVHG